jgi:tRNA-dihydrouridine synthase 1
MIDAAGYVRSAEYREQFAFDTTGADRPLIVQFAGNDPDVLSVAANLVAPHCDGVEINVGCPQKCARKGKYGAFLMDDADHLCNIVRTMCSKAEVAVLCKIRVFQKDGVKAASKGAGPFCSNQPAAMDHIDIPRTVLLAKRLQDAGCAALTVHGRTRSDGGGWCGQNPADWHVIRAVKKALDIPVISNGNIRSLQDVEACLAFTGCDGTMSATALLANPSLFDGTTMEKVKALIQSYPCLLLVSFSSLIPPPLLLSSSSLTPPLPLALFSPPLTLLLSLSSSPPFLSSSHPSPPLTLLPPCSLRLRWRSCILRMHRSTTQSISR